VALLLEHFAPLVDLLHTPLHVQLDVGVVTDEAAGGGVAVRLLHWLLEAGRLEAGGDARLHAGRGHRGDGLLVDDLSHAGRGLLLHLMDLDRVGVEVLLLATAVLLGAAAVDIRGIDGQTFAEFVYLSVVAVAGDAARCLTDAYWLIVG